MSDKGEPVNDEDAVVVYRLSSPPREEEIGRLREENQRLKDTLKACLKEGVKAQFLDGEIYIRDAGCGCCSTEPLNLTPEQVQLVKDLTLEENG